MRLADVDALRKQWKVAEKCEDCNQDARYCDGNLYGSQMYSLRDICSSLDNAPIIDAIPVEWLNERHRKCCEEGDTDLMDAITVLCNEYHVWQKEREV